MKKILSVFLCFVVIFALVSCSADSAIETAKDAANDIAETTQTILGSLTSKGDTETESITETETDNSDKNLYGPYKVVKVVDGDTIDVSVNGNKTRVRLIGVDTPESVSSDENKNCEEGKIASQYTKDTLYGKNVYLEYDVGTTDKYGRTLAYVYTEDKEMYNEILLKKGYARLMTIQPNVKYVNTFTKIQAKAREDKVGFWDGFDQWK